MFYDCTETIKDILQGKKMADERKLESLQNTIEVTERNLKVNPNHQASILTKANTLVEMGPLLHQQALKQALQCYDQLLQLDPTHAACMIERVKVLLLLKRFEDARAEFKKVVLLEREHLLQPAGNLDFSDMATVTKIRSVYKEMKDVLFEEELKLALERSF